MKIISKLSKSSICLYFMVQSYFAYANENLNINENVPKYGEVTVNFVAGTAFMATVCTDSGCSPFKFVGQSETVALSQEQNVCVSIYVLPGVSTDVYFKKLNNQNDTINFWGMTAAEHYNYTENIKFDFRDANLGFSNKYCRYLNY